MSIPTKAHLAEVEDFLAGEKFVQGVHPLWDDTQRPDEWTARWLIADDVGIVRTGTELRFRCLRKKMDQYSISLLYRSQAVFRVDVVSPNEAKANPHDGHKYGLPAKVVGSHLHSWDDNRTYIAANGFGALPYRRPTPMLMRRLPQALMTLAQAVNLTLTPEQATFDVPSQGELI